MATAETGRGPTRARAASGTDLAPVVLAIAQQLKRLLDDMESVKKRLADLEAVDGGARSPRREKR